MLPHQKFKQSHSSFSSKIPSTPRYQRNDAGEVEFIRFINVNGISPDDISVDHDHLKVTVIKTIRSRGNQKVLQDFIDLPKNSDLTKSIRVLYDDGFLIIKMPIKPKFFTAPSYGTPRSGSKIHSVLSDKKQMFVDRIKLEGHVDFNSLSVNVVGSDVQISIKNEFASDQGEVTINETQITRPIPQNVDVDRIKADLEENSLILSAPYRSNYGSLRSTRSNRTDTPVSSVFQ